MDYHNSLLHGLPAAILTLPSFSTGSTMTSKHNSESVSACLKPWHLPIPLRMKTMLLHVASLQCLPLATLPGSFPTATPCVFQACWGSLFFTTNHSVPSPNDSFSFLFTGWLLLNPFNFSGIITSSEKSSLTLDQVSTLLLLATWECMVICDWCQAVGCTNHTHTPWG